MVLPQIAGLFLVSGERVVGHSLAHPWGFYVAAGALPLAVIAELGHGAVGVGGNFGEPVFDIITLAVGGAAQFAGNHVAVVVVTEIVTATHFTHGVGERLAGGGAAVGVPAAVIVAATAQAGQVAQFIVIVGVIVAGYPADAAAAAGRFEPV